MRPSFITISRSPIRRARAVVGDVDRRRPEQIVQLFDLATQFSSQRRIEARKRLVEQEDLGPFHHRSPQRNALSLTSQSSVGNDQQRLDFASIAARSLLAHSHRPRQRTQAEQQIAAHRLCG